MNIIIVFYSLLKSPVQKTVMCPSFFFKTLKIEIFSNQHPDRYKRQIYKVCYHIVYKCQIYQVLCEIVGLPIYNS